MSLPFSIYENICRHFVIAGNELIAEIICTPLLLSTNAFRSMARELSKSQRRTVAVFKNVGQNSSTARPTDISSAQNHGISGASALAAFDQEETALLPQELKID